MSQFRLKFSIPQHRFADFQILFGQLFPNFPQNHQNHQKIIKIGQKSSKWVKIWSKICHNSASNLVSPSIDLRTFRYYLVNYFPIFLKIIKIIKKSSKWVKIWSKYVTIPPQI